MAENPNTDAEDFANLIPQRIVMEPAEFEFLEALIADDTPNDADDTPIEVRVAAYATGESLAVTVPPAWVPRIKALESVTQYGPSYQRRVVDTLVDLSHQVRSGHLELAERSLEYCERIAQS